MTNMMFNQQHGAHIGFGTRILSSTVFAAILISSALPAFARGNPTDPDARAYTLLQMMQEHRSVAVPRALGFLPAPGWPETFHVSGHRRTTLDGEEF